MENIKYIAITSEKCSACRKFKDNPPLDKDKIEICDINKKECREIVIKNKVTSIPTVFMKTEKGLKKCNLSYNKGSFILQCNIKKEK